LVKKSHFLARECPMWEILGRSPPSQATMLSGKKFVPTSRVERSQGWLHQKKKTVGRLPMGLDVLSHTYILYIYVYIYMYAYIYIYVCIYI
jgi:hypothetical protein